MPGKGRRVASRQAQLGRRRRKQSTDLQAGPIGALGSKIVETDSTSSVATQTEEVAEPDRVESPVATPRTAPVRPQRISSRNRPESLNAYNYVGAELRRILILSGVLFGVLTVLAFIL